MLAISMDNQTGEALASNLLNEIQLLEAVGLVNQARPLATAWCDVYRALAAITALPPQWTMLVTDNEYPLAVREEAMQRLAATCHPIKPGGLDALVRIIDIAQHELMMGDDLEHAHELVTELTNRLQWRMCEIIADTATVRK